MSPLQKIAMGLLIVVIPANFPRDPDPAWRFFDALPDPIGWALVIAGVWALRRRLDVAVLTWLAVAALAISVPLWFPQINHQFVHEHATRAELSLQWALSLPQTVFCAWLARVIGAAGLDHEDRYLASRFSVLSTLFWALAVLPAVVYGGGLTGLATEMLIGIGLIQIVFVFYLFRAQGRDFLRGAEVSVSPDVR